jgi:hypothetical protein
VQLHVNVNAEKDFVHFEASFTSVCGFVSLLLNLNSESLDNKQSYSSAQFDFNSISKHMFDVE